MQKKDYPEWKHKKILPQKLRDKIGKVAIIKKMEDK